MRSRLNAFAGDRAAQDASSVGHFQGQTELTDIGFEFVLPPHSLHFKALKVAAAFWVVVAWVMGPSMSVNCRLMLTRALFVNYTRLILSGLGLLG